MNRGWIQSIGIALAAASAWGAAWTKMTSGPFHVITDATNRAPRQRLSELDQLRSTLGTYLGKDDLDLVWPVNLILFANQREYTPQAPKQLLVDGPDAEFSAWMADTALPHDLLRVIARRLIEDNTQRMPDAIEQALADFMATIEIKDKHLLIGAAPGPGELPEPRMRVWAKIQMLATQPDYSGKLRIYFNNLQQGGDEDVAAHNAFNLSAAELNKRADEYYAAGNFAAMAPAGPPINPDRDFETIRVAGDDMKDLLKELASDGKTFPPDSPRGLMQQRTRDALEQAGKANPRWAAPHDALASLLGDPAAKVKELKLATSLEPRNTDYWQDLAIAEEDVFEYGEADKAWRMAERAATSDADKARLRKQRVALDERGAQAAVEEQRAKITAANDDTEAVKKAAEARLHAVEKAVNKRAGALDPGTPVLPWQLEAEGQKLSGNLTNVDCLKGGVLRLTVQPQSGPAVKLLIPDVSAVASSGNVEFRCGVVKPPKTISLVHDGKADAAQGSIGNVRTVEMP
jgi:hypothetical protein